MGVGAKTKRFPVVWQECEGILSCFFFLLFLSLLLLLEGRVAAGTEANSNKHLAFQLVRVLRGLHTSHISRGASAAASGASTTSTSRATRREGGVKRFRRSSCCRASSQRLKEPDHGTSCHLTARAPVFMLAEPVWSDGNGQRFTHAGLEN